MANHKTKTKVSAISISLLSLTVAMISSSCFASSGIAGIRVDSEEAIKVYYGNFDYEGINVTVDYKDGSHEIVPLTEDMISNVEKLKFFKIGAQDIEVVYRQRYKTTMSVEVLLNQFKDSYALVGYTCVYDGEPHAVNINQELPEGATITYPYGNIFTNAGTYEVVGVMSKNGYESKTLTTTLTIEQAERDASGIVFEDTTLVYNGEMRSVEATGVPEGVEVTYDTYDAKSGYRINKVVNAGQYRVVAHFTDTSPNYAKIPDKEITLTIERAHYDLPGIALEDVVKQYDGQTYSPKITNEQTLPTGVSVSYSCLDENGNPVINNAAVGTYTMVASFVGVNLDNYYPIEPLKATLTVSQRVIKISDKVAFEGKTVNFDEEKDYSLEATGVPEGVQVTYENNNQHYAGEYEVIARFSAVDPNETVDVPELSAYLVINRVRRSVKTYNEATKAYDLPFTASNIKIETQGEHKVATVVGIDFETFRVVSIQFTTLINVVETQPDDFVNGTTYNYLVQFEYLDPEMNSSVILSDANDIYTYNEA